MDDVWKTPTRGNFSFEEVCREIEKFIKSDKNERYEIRIGSDAQRHGNKTRFITVIMVHRGRKGGQYYWLPQELEHVNSIKQKIMHEANLTYQYKEKLKDELENIILENDVCIVPDVDIGENKKGKTKQFIPEIKSMFNIFGESEYVQIKPNSVAASWVANKHSK